MQAHKLKTLNLFKISRNHQSSRLQLQKKMSSHQLISRNHQSSRLKLQTKIWSTLLKTRSLLLPQILLMLMMKDFINCLRILISFEWQWKKGCWMSGEEKRKLIVKLKWKKNVKSGWIMCSSPCREQTLPSQVHNTQSFKSRLQKIISASAAKMINLTWVFYKIILRWSLKWKSLPMRCSKLFQRTYTMENKRDTISSLRTIRFLAAKQIRLKNISKACVSRLKRETSLLMVHLSLTRPELYTDFCHCSTNWQNLETWWMKKYLKHWI